nr:CHAT domain-containing tetratricopeptide repeat protein [Prevotella sp.]
MKKVKYVFVFFLSMLMTNGLMAQNVSYWQTKGDSLFNEGNKLIRVNHKEEALKVFKKGLDCFRYINQGNNIYYALGEFSVGVLLADLDKNREAEHFLEQAYQRYSQLVPIANGSTCKMLYNLVDSYNKTNHNEKALNMLKVMLAKIQRFHHINSEEYLGALELAGRIYFKNSLYAQAKETYEKYLKISIGHDMFKDSLFVDCNAFTQLAECENVLGNYQNAEEYFAIADSLFTNFSQQGKYKYIHFLLLNKRGNNLIMLGERELAMECFERAAQIETGKNDERSKLITMNNQACLLLKEGCQEAYEQAYQIFQLICQEYEKLGLEKSQMYGTCKTNCAFCEMNLGKGTEGLKSVNEGISILESLGKTIDINYFVALITRIGLLGLTDDLHKIEKYSLHLSDYVAGQLRDVFPYLTEKNRSAFFEKLTSWGTFLLPTLAEEYKTPVLLKALYNSILQTRGILLNSTLNIDRILRKSSNDEYKSLYNQYMEAKKRKIDDAIQEKLERKILEILPSQGDFLKDMSINVDSVREHLGYRDIAVEFLAVENVDDEDSCYYALTLKHNDSIPHIYKICSNIELRTMCKQPLGTLYDKVWGTLSNELQGVSNVYFAVDGDFHKIPIEYYPDHEGKSLFDKKQCFRLSSTREIVKQKTVHPQKIKDVVIYGDIDYDYCENVEDSVAYQEQEVITEDSISTERGALDIFLPLKGTKFEMEQISFLLQRQGVFPVCYKKEIATEESVKALSYHSPTWLHFGTHGFYSPEPLGGAENDDEVFYQSTEEYVLSKSALVFAGANNTLLKGNPDSNRDGFLTAYEMSTLDLSKTDMLVMSACESGLGDIGSEGVFGLQRGVKKAGANSILMTLNRVNDHATTLFMVRFYQGLIDGLSKNRALLEAQKYLKNAESGKWNDMKYWASFVLLDGLN